MTKTMGPVQCISRLFKTLRYLKPTQLGFFLIRRGLPDRTIKPIFKATIRKGRSLQPLLPVTTFERSEQAFSCLNKTLEFEDGCIDWNPPSQSRLWRYHLHYFDQLRDLRRTHENKQFLVEDWIAKNPQGSQPAWEPYTVSLRIVNWVSYMLAEGSSPSQHWLNSLYTQALWLECNDERHILANHYFENIKALLFAGVFFQGPDADRWLVNGQQLLLSQLTEQFLDDGGHYERSPHYHSLMMENLLDLLNLCHSNPGILASQTEAALKHAAVRGLAFLHRITLPDGGIPLFNDAVQGAAPSIEELYVYAGKFFDIQLPEYSDEIELIDEPNSGFYGYRHNDDMLVIDCGDIGPDYQPGHTHCDFLSFELILDDEPLIVDSGVYEYQTGEMRNYVRSTAAHNTLTIDGQEQSEIWGEFRVARRAKKQQAKISLTEEGSVEFCGSYNGFPLLAEGITHQREVRCEFGGNGDLFLIQDQVQGEGVHQVDSYLHFHPDVELIDEGQGRWCLIRDDEKIAHIVVEGVADGPVTTRIESGWYCPEFGLRYKNQVLVMSIQTALPTKLRYTIERTG